MDVWKTVTKFKLIWSNNADDITYYAAASCGGIIFLMVLLENDDDCDEYKMLEIIKVSLLINNINLTAFPRLQFYEILVAARRLIIRNSFDSIFFWDRAWEWLLCPSRSLLYTSTITHNIHVVPVKFKFNVPLFYKFTIRFEITLILTLLVFLLLLRKKAQVSKSLCQEQQLGCYSWWTKYCLSMRYWWCYLSHTALQTTADLKKCFESICLPRSR